jgi:hypothetical protein
MFDPSQEVSIDFDQEISNDVQEECSKYGSVVHVWADRTSKVGGGGCLSGSSRHDYRSVSGAAEACVL